MTATGRGEAPASAADRSPFTADEMMTACAARALTDGMTCFVGIGLPSAAANLARATHAPGLVLIYESGTIGAKPGRLPLSIGDGILAETADAVVSVPEIFNYWLQPGRIGIGFLGAAQIDRFGNINTTVIGASYADPKVRLPGAGGAPEIAASCREVIVVVRQSRRSFVDRVDFVTSVGFGDGPGYRERRGLTGAGPRKVITDLGILEPDPASCELTLTGIYPGVTVPDVRARTGWELAVSDSLADACAADRRGTRRLAPASGKQYERVRESTLMTTHPPADLQSAVLPAGGGRGAPAAGFPGLPVHRAARTAPAAGAASAAADRDHRPAARPGPGHRGRRRPDQAARR